MQQEMYLLNISQIIPQLQELEYINKTKNKINLDIRIDDYDSNRNILLRFIILVINFLI